MNLLLNIRAKYFFLRANGIYYNCQQKGVDRMARNTTNISIRMDADLKAQADALFTDQFNYLCMSAHFHSINFLSSSRALLS